MWLVGFPGLGIAQLALTNAEWMDGVEAQPEAAGLSGDPAHRITHELCLKKRYSNVQVGKNRNDISKRIMWKGLEARKGVACGSEVCKVVRTGVTVAQQSQGAEYDLRGHPVHPPVRQSAAMIAHCGQSPVLGRPETWKTQPLPSRSYLSCRENQGHSCTNSRRTLFPSCLSSSAR